MKNYKERMKMRNQSDWVIDWQANDLHSPTIIQAPAVQKCSREGALGLMNSEKLWIKIAMI